VDDDTVGWYDEFCVFSKTADPSIILFELCSFCCRGGEDLYIAALKLMGSDYFD
jgi:hypothetical protein